MKLLFYDDFKLGVLNGNTVVDAASAVNSITHTSPQDLLNKLIEDFGKPRVRGTGRSGQDKVSLSQTKQYRGHGG